MITPHFSTKGRKGRAGVAHRCGWVTPRSRGTDDVNKEEEVRSSARDSLLSDLVDRSLEVALNSGIAFMCFPKMPWGEGFLKDVLGSPDVGALPWLNACVDPSRFAANGKS